MNASGYSIPVLHNAVGIMTPFLLAGLGGLFTELAGMLNIALEGLILLGAFASVAFASATGSLLWGILLGILSSMVLAYIFGFISLYLKANIFITGLATNLFALGFTVVLAHQIYGHKGVVPFKLPTLPVINIPFLQKIPLLGDLFLGHDIIVYISWIIVIITAIVIYKTPFGLRIRGTGLNPETMVSLGLKPRNYQMAGILISGFTCGIAGAILTLNLSAFVPNISAGRGWIALVVIYLGNKTPFGILGASFVFGLAISFSNYAQGFINIPADFILAFPYIITVLAMIFYSIWTHYRKSRKV